MISGFALACGWAFLAVFFASAFAVAVAACGRPALAGPDWCRNCDRPASQCECGLFSTRREVAAVDGVRIN